jgi:hypothetical protein
VATTGLDPHEYYFDLRHKATMAGPAPAQGMSVLAQLTAERATANPVSIVQFGLGALQMCDDAWLEAVVATAAWVERELDEAGGLAYRFPMTHTFPLDPPWYSSMAQGEAASFLLRAACVLDESRLVEIAAHAASPLLDPSAGLIVETPEGAVLEEYPTATPSFVLNGWITSLWGLRDVAEAPVDAELARAAASAFESGVDTLAARVHLYRSALGWSRYDLYPHPLINVASPMYHRVHITHLRTMHEIAPRPAFPPMIAEWERAAASPLARGVAVTRKVAFRVVRPRSRRVHPA